MAEEKKSQKQQEASLNIRALALSWGFMFFILVAILSSWSRITEMAYGFWKIYSSMLPTPFPLDMAQPTVWKHIVGVFIDSLYAFIDGIILASIWGGLYNLLTKKVNSKK